VVIFKAIVWNWRCWLSWCLAC